MPRVRLSLLVALLIPLLLAGCGTGDSEGTDIRERVERSAERARERVERVRKDARELRTRARATRKRVMARVRNALEDLEKAVPEATPTTRSPTARGRNEPGTVAGFLDDVVQSVDDYWETTFAAAGMSQPRVATTWVGPGDRIRTACRVVADDSAAFYCPADDTIYIAEVFAAELYNGVNAGLPGQRAGYGRANGDFGVAYVVAHEYAHNLQNELGAFEIDTREGSKPFELQADCMAGLWANSVYRAGKLEPGDVEEAMDTALAVGDFDYGNEHHHGTPAERRDAWLTGFESGNPPDCQRFAPA